MGVVHAGEVPMEDTERTPSVPRLRSGHRRFDRRRAARSRLLGSLVFDTALLLVAGVWLLAGRRPVAVAWAVFAMGAALWAVAEHRGQGADPARLERSWLYRGRVSVASVVAVVAVAAVFAVTLRWGIGWGWGDVVVSTVPVGVTTLAMSWWQERRSRPSR